MLAAPVLVAHKRVALGLIPSVWVPYGISARRPARSMCGHGVRVHSPCQARLCESHTVSTVAACPFSNQERIGDGVHVRGLPSAQARQHVPEGVCPQSGWLGSRGSAPTRAPVDRLRPPVQTRQLRMGGDDAGHCHATAWQGICPALCARSVQKWSAWCRPGRQILLHVYTVY